jgi:RNA polymerase sigma-70 factor (ECF subfamily)
MVQFSGAYVFLDPALTSGRIQLVYRDSSIEGRLLAGDDDAVGQVSRWVARVIASLPYWSIKAEWLDLHQEVMTRLIASLRDGRFDDRQDLRSYVQAVARYTALESLKRRPPQTLTPTLELTLHDAGEDVEGRVVARQLARLAFDMAPDECRGLMRAYFFEQRSYSEIAASRNIPIGTVKSRLARCLENLHAVIAPKGRARKRKPIGPEDSIPNGS